MSMRFANGSRLSKSYRLARPTARLKMIEIFFNFILLLISAQGSVAYPEKHETFV